MKMLTDYITSWRR